MRTRFTILLATVSATIAMTGSAAAHDPGSDGGFDGRACGSVSGVSKYGPVGVTALGVSCSVARQVAAGSVKGQKFERWRCTGKRTRFGHCHGRGIRRGAGVGWYAYH